MMLSNWVDFFQGLKRFNHLDKFYQVRCPFLTILKVPQCALLKATRIYKSKLTFSAPQPNANTFKSSANSDETARNIPFHLDIHCFPFCNWFLIDVLICNNGYVQILSRKVYFRNIGAKGLILNVRNFERNVWKKSIWSTWIVPRFIFNLSLFMTKPTKWHVSSAKT